MNRFLPFSMLLAGAALPKNIHAQELPATTNPQRPNIILFLVDDMGWQETSVPFYREQTALNRRYRTPNMERMAAKGVKFMQAYACAISSPTRCSLMSGMNAARHRVTNWTLQYNQKTDAGSSVIRLPEWSYNGIQPAEVATERDLRNATAITSFPKILQQNGYYTIHCGKAHFAAQTTVGENPLNFGFDVNIAGGANGGPGSYLAENEYGAGAFHVSGLEKYYKRGTFLTEALTLEALKAIEKPIAENKPFYLYMSHYAIHTPYNADSRFTKNYEGKHDEQLNAVLNANEVNHAALIEGMDKSLGDIMDFLDQRPEVAKNTILLFMADNGGQAVGPRQGRANFDQNWPARGGKGSAYEGGVHEPMMLYWPGNERVKGGTENQSRIIIEDFFPTILDLAGVENYETVQKVDGKSFADILRNPKIERSRVNIWHFPNLWGETQNRTEGYGAYSAIMKDDYHMIYFWETQERRLYNIREDIGETNNLAKTMPEKLEELSQELSDSLKAYGAQRPSYIETGEIIPWPDEAPVPVEKGDVVTPTAGIFKYSNDTIKYYYRVVDNRGKGNMDNCFKWTLGTHNGYKAIQATTQQYADAYEATKQYFYFMPGSDATHFKIYTVDGKPVNYVPGLTGAGWNGGNPGSGLTTPYMQYETQEAGEFQLISTGSLGRYAIRAANGDVLNNRGTGNGTVANMKWVVNTYQNIDVADPGSTYKFVSVPGNSIAGLITALYESFREYADFVGSHDITAVTSLYEKLLESPQLESLRTLQQAYNDAPQMKLEMGKIYRLRNYMRKASTGNGGCHGEGGFLEAVDANNPAHKWSNKVTFAAIDADYSHADALWRVVQAPIAGAFYLQNLNTGKFISSQEADNGKNAKATENESEALAFKTVAYGDKQFKIAQARDLNLRLHVSGNTGDGGQAVRLMYYNAEDKNTASAWYLVRARSIEVKPKAALNGNFVTTCLPVGVSQPAGIKACIGKVEGESVKLKEIVGSVASRTAVLWKAESAQPYALPIVEDQVEAPQENAFVGFPVYQSTGGAVYYELVIRDKTASLQPVVGEYVASNEALVEGVGITAPQGLSLQIGKTTGLCVLNAEKKEDNKMYELSGRRIVSPKKGVYIQNGKKIVCW